MSGVVKKVKKFVKKVVKTVVKVLPYVAMAAAVYFTAGLALSAFPSTAAFASSMPGFAGGGFMGLGIGEGAVAGSGIFSKVATAVGLGSGLQSGALVSNSAMALGMTNAEYAAALGAQSVGEAVSMASAASRGAAASVAGGGGTGAGAAAGAGGGAGAGTVAAKAGMSMADKLMLAAVGSQAIGAFLGPDEKEMIREQKKFHGAFFGMNADGSSVPIPSGGAGAGAGAPVTEASVSPQPPPSQQQGVGLVQPPQSGVQSRGTQPAAVTRNEGRGGQGLVPQQQLQSSQLDSGILFPKAGNVRYV